MQDNNTIRRSPRRSSGGQIIYRSSMIFAEISVAANFVAGPDDMPMLVVHAEHESARLPITPEDLIELGKELIAEGVRLQQRPTQSP